MHAKAPTEYRWNLHPNEYLHTSNLSRTLIGNKIIGQACRRCSIYISIRDLTPGLNGLGRGNYKTRRENILVLEFDASDIRGLADILFMYTAKFGIAVEMTARYVNITSNRHMEIPERNNTHLFTKTLVCNGGSVNSNEMEYFRHYHPLLEESVYFYWITLTEMSNETPWCIFAASDKCVNKVNI